MNLTKKDLIYLLIILCLFVGWFTAVSSQQTAVNHVKGLYNKLVDSCNEIIGVKDINDFCITLPDGITKCNQQDLNLFKNF